MTEEGLLEFLGLSLEYVELFYTLSDLGVSGQYLVVQNHFLC